MIYVLIGLTLLIGTTLSNQAPSLMILYAAYYGLCLFALKSIDYGESFFSTFNCRQGTVPEKELLVAGTMVAPKIEEDNQENRFLNIFAAGRLIKRRVLTWMLFLAGLWFFHFNQGVEFSVNTVIPLLSCILIVNSFYVGHFLAALLINLVVVIYNYSPEVFFPFYYLYAAFFLVTLYCIGTKSHSFDFKKILQVSTLALIWLGLSYGLSWFLPDKMMFKETKTEMTPEDAGLLRGELRKLKLDLNKFQPKIPSHKTADLLKQIGLLEQLTYRPLSSREREDALQKLKDSIHTFNNLKNEWDEELSITLPEGSLDLVDRESLARLQARSKETLTLDQRIQKLQDITREIEGAHTQLAKVNLTASDQQKFEEKLQNWTEMAQTLKAPDELTNKEKQAVQNVISRHPQHDWRQIEQLLNKSNLSPEERQQLVNGLKESDLRPKASEGKLEGISPQMEEKLLQTLSETSPEESSLFDRLKKMLPILIGAFILILLNYLLRKRGIKKIEGTDPQIVEELKSEWGKLRSLKFSPREEVIHYYNLFHMSLQKMHYIQHETPPSCIVYRDMKEFNPVLEKSTLVMTEVFAQCFYGQKEVTPEALKLFRKAVKRMLKVYQLT